MAEQPVYVTNLSSVGVPIAADQRVVAGTSVAVQQVELLGAGSSTGIPGNAAGLMVQFSSVPQVAISQMPAVSGTVSVSGSVPVSGTISVSAMPAVSGTVSVSDGAKISVVSTIAAILGSVLISGTVTAGGTVTVANGPSVTIQQGASVSAPALAGVAATAGPPGFTASGVPVWLIGGQTTTGTPVLITPTILTVNTAPTVAGASVTVQAGVSVTVVTQLGTQVVSIVPGPSVTIQQGASVTIQQGASVTVQAGVSVTVVTQLGTQVVSIVPGVSVSLGSLATIVGTTTATSGATGPIVWLGASQSVLIGGQSITIQQGASVTVQAGVSVTVVTQLGTQVVSVVPGLSVTAGVSGFVSISAVVAQATQLNTTGLPVWLAPTQTMAIVSTVGTLLGTINVAIVAGAGGGGSVTVGAPSISATGQVMWIAGGQGTTVNPVVVTGTVVAGAGTTVVSVSAIVAQATQVNTTGVPVWLAPTQTMGVLSTVVTVLGTVNVNNIKESTYLTGITSGGTGVGVWPGTPAYVPVVINVTATSETGGANYGTTLLFTVWTGLTQAGAALTQWVVPAGFNLRLMNIQGMVVASAVNQMIKFVVNMATASGSFTSANQETAGRAAMIAVSATNVTAASALNPLFADVPAGTTIGIHVSLATNGTVAGLIVQGYLF